MDKSVYHLFASIFPLMVCSGIIYSVFSLFIAEMGATEAVVGFVFAIGSASGAFAGPLFGKLSDKFGRRSILLVSMVIFVIVFLLYAVASDVLHVSIIQGLEGVAWAAEGATAIALIADNVPSKERGQAMHAYCLESGLGSWPNLRRRFSPVHRVQNDVHSLFCVDLAWTSLNTATREASNT